MTTDVTVAVTTVTGDETLYFPGSGQLTRNERGVHLTYRYEDGGQTVPSEIHLGMGRAVLKSPACRLLLDPSRRTETQIVTECGAMPLTVETHLVRADLDGGAGTITLHYTLLAQGTVAQTLRVTLELTAIE